MQSTYKKKTKSADEEILHLARERFAIAEDAERELRQLANEDLEFAHGKQWDEADLKQRAEDRRPTLTINRLPTIIRQVTNDLRQNRPAIKVSPVDDLADVEKAKILQGLVRHIEQSSNADTAYDVAGTSAAKTGFGFLRVTTEYDDAMSFNQSIKIHQVADRFSCYLDPNSQELDGSDANWGFAFTEYFKDEFKQQFPGAEASGMEDWGSLNNLFGDWISKEKCRVAEYFYKEYKKAKIILFSDGSTQIEENAAQYLQKAFDSGAQVEPIDTRETTITQIKWIKTNGLEVLESTDWKGRWIPIVPVFGDKEIINGKKVYEGLVRHAKDPQRMLNFHKSNEAETIALAPKAPFVGVEGQFEGHEAAWKSANTKTHAYLQYKPKSIGGILAPAPQRQAYEPPVQAITNASLYAADDLKATIGIFDAAMGKQGNETSGIAIQRRNQQSQTTNFHIADNLSKSIRHIGRIVVDLIPHYYDGARTERIIGEDGSEELVKLNQEYERNGEQVMFDFSTGKYDVSVSSGPSYETKRQEAASVQLELTKVMPQLSQVAADLIVGNLDIPNAKEFAERLKKTLPPGIIDDKGSKDIPPEIKAQMDQSAQMIEQLTQKLNEASDREKTDLIKIESHERIELKKLEVAAEMKLAELGSKEAILMLTQEIQQISNRLDNQLRFNEPLEPVEPELQFQNGAGPAAAPPTDQQPLTSEQQPLG